MQWMTTAEGWAALLTLTVLEIVLGIDNIIFIAIVAGRLPAHSRERARRTGLFLAMFIRIGLLLSIVWVMGLTRPLATIFGLELSGRSLILLGGGLFLIAKATHELYERVEHGDEAESPSKTAATAKTAGFGATLAQILALDIVFSLDSVITAVGMVPHIPIMITAMVLAVIVMLIFADAVSGFINRHPSMKVLALSFLLLIGVLLVADSFDRHINKGYVYFAMAFSFVVEMINMRVRKRSRVKKS